MNNKFDLDNFTDELEKEHFTQSEINQFVKAREQDLIIPRNVKDLDIIREFRRVCKGKSFNNYQQREILRGVQHHIDTSKYADPKFKYAQMEQIRIGLQKGIEVDIYADPKFAPNVMRHIRILLEKKMSQEVIDCFIKKSASLNYSDTEHLRFALEDGFDPEKVMKMRDLSASRLDKERLSLNKK